MNLVNSILNITESYNAVKAYNKSLITNLFLNANRIEKLIKDKEFFEIRFEETIFFLRRKNTFTNLYYYSTSYESLEKSLKELLKNINTETLIVDIISKDEINLEKNIFESSNFNIYTSLVRMSAMSDYQLTNQPNEAYIRNANEKDSIELIKLLNNFFDPKAEQLPDLDDIHSWIKNDNIILYVKNDEILGFIIYDLTITTLYLRYWFVHPSHRDLKIGSKLFKEFMYRGKNTKRQLFWVIQTNDNAINRYLHYGFKKENMFNFVLTNKKINYEN